MTTHESSGTPAVYTLAEAAAILRVKESWLERQAAARKIPFTMLGGAYRFTTEHLTAIVRIHEKTPDQESSGAPASDAKEISRTRPSSVPLLTPLQPRPRLPRSISPRRVA